MFTDPLPPVPIEDQPTKDVARRLGVMAPSQPLPHRVDPEDPHRLRGPREQVDVTANIPPGVGVGTCADTGNGPCVGLLSLQAPGSYVEPVNTKDTWTIFTVRGVRYVAQAIVTATNPTATADLQVMDKMARSVTITRNPGSAVLR